MDAFVRIIQRVDQRRNQQRRNDLEYRQLLELSQRLTYRETES
jgi:hypothetical protein